MKKIAGIIGICIVMVTGLLGLTGCGEKTPYSSYNLDDYVQVGEYKGLETSAIEISVSDLDVDEEIQTRLKAQTSTESVEEGQAVKDGDTVNINYVGTMDGKKFDGGSADNYDLQIGSGAFIQGFEEGLIGKKVGQKNIKLNLAFPLNYSSTELAGKDVVFTVTINSAAREVTPAYNDEFIQSQGDYKNKEEYEAAVKKDVEAQKTEAAQKTQKENLWSQVLENSEMKKYPEDELNNYKEFNSKQIDDYAEEYGVTRAELLEQYGFSGEEDFAAVNDDSSKLRVKQEMILKYISDKEGLEATSEQKEKAISDLETQGYTEDMVLQSTGRTMDEYAYLQTMYENVLSFLLDNAKIVE